MSTELAVIFLRSAFAIFTLMTIVWIESVRRRDASIVDLVWGLGFVIVGWTSFVCVSLASSSVKYDALLLPVLTSIWGIRLSVYLYWRNHGKPEDYRYQAMRRKWGKSFPWISAMSVFALQGLVMWVVSLPLQVSVIGSLQPSIWLWIGLCLFAIGFFFEAVGDWQLARFKLNQSNANRVLDSGLWRYTRHPNYFGDFVVWWAFFFLSVSQTGVWWTFIGPLFMSILLMKISGVTLLEKSLVVKKPQYADYVARTNAFFPGPPKR